MDFIPSYFEWWHIPVVLLAGMIGEGYAGVIGRDIGGCLGSSFGVIAAYSKNIWSNKRLLVFLGLPFLIGGMVGTLFLTKISPVILSYVLIAALAFLLLLMLFRKNQEPQDLHALHIDLKEYPLVASLMLGLGVYANVSGVGGGTFMKVAYTSLLRMKVADGIGVSNIIDLGP